MQTISIKSHLSRRIKWRLGLVWLSDLILEWQDRARERQILRSLTDWELKDVGLNRENIQAEIEKSFWQN